MVGWQKTPLKLDVKKGETKIFCSCDGSKNAPFCDGSHRGTDKTPWVHTFDGDKTVYVCCCKGSKKRPFCDGTHKNLP
ncbi:MAG: CDGSH iron-sulfur domain-containing protein [Pseudomonadota bacterium]